MGIIVIKSNGNEQEFDFAKIKKSLLKSYESVNQSPSNLEKVMEILKLKIDNFLENGRISTKIIGDLVEKTLIELNEYDIAKSYILYRSKIHDIKENKKSKNTYVIKNNGKEEKFNFKKIEKVFKLVGNDLPECSYEEFKKEVEKYLIPKISSDQLMKLLVKAAVDKISIENISWQKIAGRLLLISIYKKASRNLGIKIDDLYTKENYVKLFNHYIEKGYYFKYFKKFYKDSDILKAGDYIKKERDFEYGYSTILMYDKRYLLNPNKIVKEIPQQMYMSVALFLAIPEGLDSLPKDIYDNLPQKDKDIISNSNKTLEDILEISEETLQHPWLKDKRLEVAYKIYDYTSTGKISLPTPTLLNARTNFHQLSSCFKFNIADDLRGIYHTIENMAQISKFGGGIGSYLGHIRAKGASIRGVEGVSGGVLPWIKVMNDTAIAVNQLGARSGSISVTIDIWHLDMLDFLEMQTETGDIRNKSFDVFPAISIPDLFMERVKSGGKWTLFDPKEVKDVLGVRIEDYYGDEFKRLYEKLENNPNIKLKEELDAKDLFKQFLKTVVETGMPYVFFRDTANKYNPNKHEGMVYSTQLCTEIIQNTSESEFIEETFEDGTVNIKYKPGDTVVCNLASINIAKVNSYSDNIEDVHNIAMRILDNVITMNFYPINETKLTAMKYRAVGLGYMGLAEYLATKAKIRYDSKEAISHVDKLFEQYAYYTLKASLDLAKERGKYSKFDGSERSKGILFGKDISWFEKNSDHALEWKDLIENIKKYGTRFAYHQAPAPNTSTALVVGTTAGLLPVYKKYFVDTNSKGITVNVAPNLSKDNFWLYKEYVHMNMANVIDVIGAIQKWIDQSISFEWIINPMEVSPLDLFNYYIQARSKEIKTVYYVRSMSLEVDKCESCSG